MSMAVCTELLWKACGAAVFVSPRAPALRLSVSLVSIAAVFVVAITSSPCRNGLKFSGGFGRQRCLMLPFLCRVIPHRSGGLGLPSLLWQLFIEGDVPEVMFFQNNY